MSLEMSVKYLTKEEYEFYSINDGSIANAFISKEFSDTIDNKKYIYFRIQVINDDMQNTKDVYFNYSIPSTNLTLLENYTKIRLNQSTTDIISKLENAQLNLVITKAKDNTGADLSISQTKISSSKQKKINSITANSIYHYFGYLEYPLANNSSDIFSGSFDINLEE